MNDKYLPIKELNASAYDFLLKTIEKLKNGEFNTGKFELQNGCFVNVQEYTSKKRTDAKFEAHKKYIDIQFVFEGSELIAIESLDTMRSYPVISEYSEEKDVELYTPNCEGVDKLLLAGDFLIIPPADAHAPGICVNEQVTVKKAIFKIPV